MKNTETLKLLKRFAAISLIMLCGIAMVCGAAIVNQNSRALAFGEPGQQVGFVLDPQVVTVQSGEFILEWSPALRWARFAPAPAGTWLMLVYSFTL